MAAAAAHAAAATRKDDGIMFSRVCETGWPIPKCNTGHAEILAKRNAIQTIYKQALFTQYELVDLAKICACYHWFLATRFHKVPVLTGIESASAEQQVNTLQAVEDHHATDCLLFLAVSMAIGVLMDETVLIKPTRIPVLALACCLLAYKRHDGYYYLQPKDFTRHFKSERWAPDKKDVLRMHHRLLRHYAFKIPPVHDKDYGLLDLCVVPTQLRETEGVVFDLGNIPTVESQHVDFKETINERRLKCVQDHLELAINMQWFSAALSITRNPLNLIEFVCWPPEHRTAMRECSRDRPQVLFDMLKFLSGPVYAKHRSLLEMSSVVPYVLGK